MLKHLRLAGVAALLAGLAASPAFAIGLTNPAPVQQDPTRLDAASSCSYAPAVNVAATSATCTITPPAGQFVYVDSLIVYACLDGTASISSIQQNFTSTNLGNPSFAYETALISGSTITTNATDVLCQSSGQLIGTSPLKSTVPGTAITIVPPAAATHASFGQFVAYHFAP